MARSSKQHDLSKDEAGSGSADFTNGNTKSFAERLGASAAILTRQALLQPSGGAIAQTVGSLSTNTEKGESSSSSAASEESFSNSDMFSSRPSSMASDAKKIAISVETETSQKPTDTHQRDFSDSTPFDLDVFLSKPDLPLLGVPSSTALDDRPLALNQEEFEENVQKDNPESSSAQQGFEDYLSLSHGDENCSSASHSHLRNARSTLSKSPRKLIDSTDGAAVVDLLSKPSLYIDDEIEGQVPTSAEISDIDRQSKNPETAQREVRTSRKETMIERQLMPDFALTETGLKTIAQSIPRAAIDEAHNAELGPWLEILNSYQDEVWGDMLPLVQQAREELAMTGDSKNALDDKPAVRRLKMLLSHLAPHKNT
ncbi:MAG: hypothetical protein Q9191_000447 [Dirinaria sp. TL-2023a]